jgi:uncharacterized protein (TIGR00725 family)
MKKIIGVMGPGEKQSTKEDTECAFQIGKIVAKTGAVLLCGGMSGTMEASAQGAKEAGGLTVGIGPTKDKADMNPYIDIPLLTNMSAGRNYMNAISSDILIFVSVGSPGTLSELAFAIQMEVPSIVIRGSEKLKSYISEFTEDVIFVDSIEELESKLNDLLIL